MKKIIRYVLIGLAVVIILPIVAVGLFVAVLAFGSQLPLIDVHWFAVGCATAGLVSVVVIMNVFP